MLRSPSKSGIQASRRTSPGRFGIVVVTALLISGCGASPGSSATAGESTPIATSTAVTSAVATPIPPEAQASPGVLHPLASLAAVGLEIGDRLPIPGMGPVAFADGSVWVVDGADGEVANGQPVGQTYRIDPTDGHTILTIKGAVGGCGVVGLGAVWLCTLADDLDVITRIDTSTNKITKVASGLGPGSEPEAIGISDDALWIGSNNHGTVQRYDPDHLKSMATIDVASPVPGGLRGQTATDKTSVWFGIAFEPGEIARIDTKLNTKIGALTLPTGPTNGLWLVGTTLYVSTPDHLYELDASGRGDPRLMRDLALPGTGQPILDLASAYGRLWATRKDPMELDRIDPASFTLEERVAVPHPGSDDGPVEMAFGADRFWIRTTGELLSLRR
jgi:hypothetical protein